MLIPEFASNWPTFVDEVFAGVVAAVIAFCMGRLWEAIPRSLYHLRLRRFWSKAVSGSDFVISYGALDNVTPRVDCNGNLNFRYRKQYHDNTSHNLVGGNSVVADCELQAVAYLTNALGGHRKTPIAIEGDHSAFENLDRTFVSLGSPPSNEVTRLILREPNNAFLEFDQTEDEHKTTFIRDKQTGEEYRGFEGDKVKDRGVIVKLPNERFPGHYFFVCAGLGESGTSGAAWYLATYWRRLQKEFRDEAFGIIVEVEIGSDNSALRVFPERTTWWQRIRARVEPYIRRLLRIPLKW